MEASEESTRQVDAALRLGVEQGEQQEAARAVRRAAAHDSEREARHRAEMDVERKASREALGELQDLKKSAVAEAERTLDEFVENTRLTGQREAVAVAELEQQLADICAREERASERNEELLQTHEEVSRARRASSTRHDLEEQALKLQLVTV